MKVDAYWVPASQAEAYRASREALANAARAHFLAAGCAKTQRCWAGSEDGEAVVGLDGAGALVCLVHLDPFDTDSYARALADNSLEAFWKAAGCPR